MESLIHHLQSLPALSVHLTLAGILLLCGLGLPIPEDISLITAGYMAHRGIISVHTAFLVSFFAVLGGDAIAFFIGRFFGRRFLAWKPAQRIFSVRKQMRVRAYFRKYGSKVIFIGRFLPGLRFSIFVSAGTLCVRPAVFFVFDTLAALVSVPFLVYSAWHFGGRIDSVIAWARRSEYGMLALAAVAVVVIGIKVLRGRRLRRNDVSEADRLYAAEAPASPDLSARAERPRPSVLPDP